MKMLTVVCVVLVTASCVRAEEKRLFGFERKEVDGWAKLTADTPTAYSVYHNFSAATGDATEGKFALGRTLSTKYGYIWPGNNTSYYIRTRSGRVFNAHGWFRRAMPKDFSGFRFLRMDFKIEGAAARKVRLELEDEWILNPVVRTFAVPAGRWVTLQLDLAAAAKQRKLDLTNIATMQLLVTELDKAKTPAVAKLDNIRLASADAKAELPLIEDPSPMTAPAAPPWAPKLLDPIELKTRPDAAPAGPVTVVRYSGKASYPLLRTKERCIGGFADAGLLMMDGATHVRMSRDAGATWTDLTGTPDAATRLSGNVRGHRMTIYATGTEIAAAFVTNHCAGGSGRTELHFQRAAYENGRWAVSPTVVFETGIRHCADRFAMIRDAGGRLWLAWDHLNRLGRYAIHAIYSEDDGRSWKPAGAGRRIGPAFRGMPAGPYLARDGKYVMAFWRRPDSSVTWARFDGKQWSPPVTMPKRFVPTSAVNVGGTIYLATTKPAQILRFDGKAWTPDSPAGLTTGLLSRSGSRVVCLWKQSIDAGEAILYSTKTAGGAWSKPAAVVTETGGIQGIAAPQHAPDTFVPVAWADKTKRWIKATRIDFAHAK